MLVIFVHGWSVTDTGTYALLPEALSARAKEYELNIEIKHVWLGRYISFRDEVSMGDIVRAFDRALREQVFADDGIKPFSCITHSTGGPVVREWIERYYGAENLDKTPLNHLVMLAPANHGSALAALGKEKVGRIKAWFEGIEPGQRILDWLCLGSRCQVKLSKSYLNYKLKDSGFFPFVLTGQSIDKKMYDFINSYLAESGSDGVVRVAGANLNYSMVKFKQTDDTIKLQHAMEEIHAHMLTVDGDLKRPDPVPMGVIPGASHSGRKKGIMGSVLSSKSNKTQIDEILKCLKVKNQTDFENREKELSVLSEETQKSTHRYSMLVFIIKDDQGDPVCDYDLFLLGSNEHSPDKLTKGFFIDRQQNSLNKNNLIYYIDYDIISKKQLTGFRVIARPSEGFAFYHSVEYRSLDINLNDILKPNETFYIEIELKRCVDQNAFRFDNASSPKAKTEGLFIKKTTRHDFKNEEPSGKEIE